MVIAGEAQDTSSGWRLLGIGALGLALVIIVDRLVSGVGVFDERSPEFSWPYLLRSAALACASFVIMAGGRRVAVTKLPRADVTSYGGMAWLAPTTTISLLTALGAGALLLASPTTLTNLVREDRLVEWCSAAFGFLAGSLLLVAVVRNRTRSGSPLTAAALVVLAGLFVLIGLEEVSWFQRVLDIETPAGLVDRNSQRELNLHNLATGPSENLFYGGAFLFGVAWPFVLGDRRLPGVLAALGPVAPTPLVLYGSAVVGGIVFEMWNVLAIQLTFWMSLAAMVLVDSAHPGRHLARYSAVTLVAVAAIFLSAGDTMIRDWDDTEVRELVILFNLFVYAAGVVAATGAPRTEPSRATSFSR